MSDDLYFIPMIMNVIDGLDNGDQTVLDTIEKMGKDVRYRAGFVQYKKFMESVKSQFYIGIDVIRDGKKIKSVNVNTIGSQHTISNIIPGNYTFVASTGRILWMSKIRRSDICWTDTDICLAAETELSEPQWNREETILDGDITIQIYPGLESGFLVITSQ